MCEDIYLIYRIAEDTDVRLFDRYRRTLGLDHKLAQRVAICQCNIPLRIYVTHTMFSHRFGRRPGLQSKWRTCFAGASTVIQNLPTNTSTSTGIGSSQWYPTCFMPLLIITALKPARGYTRYVPLLVHNSMYGNNPHQIPVALAMWNQVGSECSLPCTDPALGNLYTRSCTVDSDLRLLQPKQIGPGWASLRARGYGCLSTVR